MNGTKYERIIVDEISEKQSVWYSKHKNRFGTRGWFIMESTNGMWGGVIRTKVVRDLPNRAAAIAMLKLLEVANES